MGFRISDTNGKIPFEIDLKKKEPFRGRGDAVSLFRGEITQRRLDSFEQKKSDLQKDLKTVQKDEQTYQKIKKDLKRIENLAKEAISSDLSEDDRAQLQNDIDTIQQRIRNSIPSSASSEVKMARYDVSTKQHAKASLDQAKSHLSDIEAERGRLKGLGEAIKSEKKILQNSKSIDQSYIDSLQSYADAHSLENSKSPLATPNTQQGLNELLIKEIYSKS